MTVNNTTATLNEPLQIYQHDRGITLRIKVLKHKYSFNKIEEENMVEVSQILSARAVVLKPNGDKFECPRQNIEDDLVIIPITLNWTDDFAELGDYTLQIQLYGKDHINERVTLPPVKFRVAPVIYIPEEGVSVPSYADAAYIDNDYLTDFIGEVDDGNLPYGIYDKTTWKPGDVLTAEELNKSEKAIEYLIRTRASSIFFPDVSEEGVISWTNGAELDNPAPVNIMGPQGPVGPQGAQGIQGERGADGTSIKILGTVPIVDSLEYLVDTAEPGDSYLVTHTGEVWVYTAEDGFVNLGPIQGPQGPQGPKGEPLHYSDLTDDDKADLQYGFVTGEGINEIKIVTQYPAEPKDGVLYIRVEE